jgi:hypothetical protein
MHDMSYVSNSMCMVVLFPVPAGIRDAMGTAARQHSAYFAIARDTNTADLGHG